MDGTEILVTEVLNMKCPACGFTAQSDFEICAKCGIVVKKYMVKKERVDRAQSIQPQIQPTNNALTLKVTIGVLLGIILVGAGYLMTGREKPSPQINPTYVITKQQVPVASQQVNSDATQKTNVPVPPVAIEAVNAMKKLEAKTQVGIAYKDYGSALADAKFALNLFQESSASKEFPEMAKSITKAFDTYKMASDIWALKFNKGKVEDFTSDLTPGSPAWSVTKTFPETAKEGKDGGLMYSGSLHISSAISFLFTEANKETQIASAMISR